MCASECGVPAGTNWGRKAKKKIVSFGFSRFSVIPETITCADAWSGRPPVSTASAPVSRQVAHAR